MFMYHVYAVTEEAEGGMVDRGTGVSQLCGTGNWIQVFCKSNQYFSQLSHPSGSWIDFLNDL